MKRPLIPGFHINLFEYLFHLYLSLGYCEEGYLHITHCSTWHPIKNLYIIIV